MTLFGRSIVVAAMILVVLLWCVFLGTDWFGVFFVGLFVTTFVAVAVTFFW